MCQTGGCLRDREGGAVRWTSPRARCNQFHHTFTCELSSPAKADLGTPKGQRAMNTGSEPRMLVPSQLFVQGMKAVNGGTGGTTRGTGGNPQRGPKSFPSPNDPPWALSKGSKNTFRNTYRTLA